MKRLALSALLLLTACGTPQEQCIRQNTRDLRTVERLIIETEENLRRGYALESQTRYDEYWSTCYRRHDDPATPATPYPCLKERSYTVQVPKAIDLNAEARKLDSLREKRAELSRAAQPVIAECRARYPE
jgi:hypothetical protein